MLWSLVKIILFIAIAVALAFGAVWVLETPGQVQIAFAGREFTLTPIGALVGFLILLGLALILLKVVGFLIALFRFLLGDDTAISRYFRRGRERRGFDALADGLVALAAGDPRTAKRQAQKAERLLDRPDVTRIVNAQAAELAGDDDRALGYYKAMLQNDRTRFVGIKGLMQKKLAAGDTDTALALAQKAFALRPNNPGVLTTLFDLQSKKADWSGARETMNASMHAKLLPRDVATRRDAVLSLADARAALVAGNETRGQAAALQAQKLAPTLIPAAALAAEVLAKQGSARKAQKILVNAWMANPHPDLAAAYAAMEPGETPHQRRDRFGYLTKANPDHPESRLLTAELALADEDFPAARKALGDLAEREPTTRSLALMAAIERGQGAPDAVVRGWLTRALGASRGPQWTCGNCNHVHAAWGPVCENCGAFDTLSWRLPPHTEDAGLAGSSMLPLIVGGPEPTTEAAPAAVDTPPRPDVEDAVVADGPRPQRLSGTAMPVTIVQVDFPHPGPWGRRWPRRSTASPARSPRNPAFSSSTGPRTRPAAAPAASTASRAAPTPTARLEGLPRDARPRGSEGFGYTGIRGLVLDVNESRTGEGQ
jgi:HemY protein